MSDSAYKNAVNAAEASLPPAPNFPGVREDYMRNIRDQYNGTRRAAAEAIAETQLYDRSPDAAAKAAKMTQFYSRFLNDVTKHNGRIVHAYPAQATAQTYAFFNEWYSREMQNPANNDALVKLKNKMQGPGITSLWYDDHKAKETDSTMAGVKWMNVAASLGAAFALPNVLGVSGVWAWIVGGVAAIGASYGVDLIQKNFFSDKKEETPAPAPGVAAPQPPAPDMSHAKSQVAGVPLQNIGAAHHTTTTTRPSVPLATQKPGTTPTPNRPQ